MGTTSCWRDLPREMLESIWRRLDTDIDVVRLRSVCVSWRSSVPRRIHKKSSLLATPLHLPVWVPPDDFGSKEILGAFRLTESTVYRLEQVNEASSSNSAGRLVRVHVSSPGNVRILNLISGFRIDFPPKLSRVMDLSSFRVSVVCKAYKLEYIICGDHHPLQADKVVVSLNRAGDYVVMAIQNGGKAGFLRQGDQRWTVLHDNYDWYEDAINYNNVFCAVNAEGKAVAYDSSFRSSEIAAALPRGGSGQRKHLIESSGDLLLVDKWLKSVSCGTKNIQFKLYKLDIENRRWDKIQSIGDVALFLGEDCSFSVSARDLPGLKGGCIFFEEERFTGNSDRGRMHVPDRFMSNGIAVFDLDKEIICPVSSFPQFHSLFSPFANCRR